MKKVAGFRLVSGSSNVRQRGPSARRAVPLSFENDKELPDVDGNGWPRRMKQTPTLQSEWPLIESASAADLEQILQLEEACFSAPWTRKMLEAELSGNQFAHFLIAKGSGLQAETTDIAGYLCFWVVFEELRIMNLAIKASARRRGIARRLVTRTLEIGL